MRGLSSGADADDMPDLTPELQPIARAMALLWTFRTRAAILNLARKLGYRSVRGDPLKLQEATAAIARLLEQGVAQESPEREGLLRLGDRLRAPLYAELLAATMALDLQRALHDVEGFRLDDNLKAWRLRDPPRRSPSSGWRYSRGHRRSGSTTWPRPSPAAWTGTA